MVHFRRPPNGSFSWLLTIVEDRLNANPILNDLIKNIDIYQPLKNPHIMFVCLMQDILFDVQRIQLKVFKILGNVNIKDSINKFDKEKIYKILHYYGISESEIDIDNLTVESLIHSIQKLKKSFLSIEDSSRCSEKLLRNFVKNSSRTSESHVFLEIADSLCKYNKFRRKINLLQTYRMFSTEELELQIENLANEILNEARGKADDRVGSLIMVGWPGKVNMAHVGHVIGMEVRFLSNGRYQFIVGNGGEGVKEYHSRNYQDDPDDNDTRILFKTAPYYTIQTYEIKSEIIAKQVLMDLIRLRAGLVDLEDREASSIFYSYFRNNKNIMKYDHRIPSRPIQKTGSCIFFSLMEIVFNILQRNDHVEEANHFQDYIREISVNHSDLYPALEEALREKPPKPEILPYEGSLDHSLILKQKVAIEDQAMKVEHFLPKEKVHIIGSKGDILLRIQGKDFQKISKLYCENNVWKIMRLKPKIPLTIMRNKKLIHVEYDESVDLQKDDLLMPGNFKVG